MILLEKTQVSGWEAAIRGMRNPMNSWEKGDSGLLFTRGDRLHHASPVKFQVGDADHDLMMRLAKGGPVHAKYRRMIVVTVDITAPLYWWKEFDTYKVGTVANSCSTMHKIHAKEFTLDDFSHEHLLSVEESKEWESIDGNTGIKCTALGHLDVTVRALNTYRKLFLETKDKRYWWQMIQLLPSSYNQKRTVMLNYEVLAGIYPMRRNHKLDEWCEFCRWIERLPYSEVIVGEPPKPLTYEEIRRKFAEKNPLISVCDYRPYPLSASGLVVWVDAFAGVKLPEEKEFAFEYDAEKDIFTLIPGAKPFDEIFNGGQS